MTTVRATWTYTASRAAEAVSRRFGSRIASMSTCNLLESSAEEMSLARNEGGQGWR